MESLSSGVDIVSISRIERASKNNNLFLKRVFTERERDFAFERRFPYRHLAGFFAAKEAVMKALGYGWSRAVNWKDIEIIVIKRRGLFRVRLHSGARPFAKGKKIFLSISCAGDLATAFTVIE